MKRLLGLAALLCAATTVQTRADQINLACSFDGGAVSFVATGDTVRGTGFVASATGNMRKAHVATDMKSPPVIALIVRGQSPRAESRDTYLVDLTAGKFVHVNEVWFTDEAVPALVVQHGTCVGK